MTTKQPGPRGSGTKRKQAATSGDVAPTIGGPGHWIDETVPDLSNVLTPRCGTDVAEFSAWLGPMLGTYRSALQLKDVWPGRAHHMKSLAALRLALDRAHVALTDGVHPMARAYVRARAFAHGVQLLEVETRMGEDLALLSALVKSAEDQLAMLKAPSGRKPTKAGDDLAVAVVERLHKLTGMKLIAARGLAREILQACGAHPPADMKRPSRRVQK